MDYSNEETLIRGLRNREDAAIEYLRRKTFRRIFAMSRKAEGNEEDAKDLFNDGIAGLIEKIDNSNEPIKNVGMMLCSICYRKNNKILLKNSSRKRYLNGQVMDGSYEENFEAQLDSPIFQSIFWSSFKKLQDICKELIEKMLEERTTKQIAEALGLSAETVRQRKHRCQKAILGLINVNPEFERLRRNNELPDFFNRIKK